MYREAMAAAADSGVGSSLAIDVLPVLRRLATGWWKRTCLAEALTGEVFTSDGESKDMFENRQLFFGQVVSFYSCVNYSDNLKRRILSIRVFYFVLH